MPLTVSMLLELASATAWTFYYIFEAAVKLFIPSKMFHKVCKQTVDDNIVRNFVTGYQRPDSPGHWRGVRYRKTDVPQVGVNVLIISHPINAMMIKMISLIIIRSYLIHMIVMLLIYIYQIRRDGGEGGDMGHQLQGQPGDCRHAEGEGAPRLCLHRQHGQQVGIVKSSTCSNKLASNS